MADDDQELELELLSHRHEISQFASSLVELAAAVDIARDIAAREFLLTAMSGIAYMMNPPKGKVYDLKVKKSPKTD